MKAPFIILSAVRYGMSITGNFSDCLNNGVYVGAGSSSNDAPSNKYDYVTMIVSSWWRGGLQLAAVVSNTYGNFGKIYIRTFDYQQTFTAWKQIAAT